MGNTLRPNTEKTSFSGYIDGTDLRYAGSGMMGRRSTMEDFHLAQGLPNSHAIFGVFDGHGGTYASKFAAARFVEILESRTTYIEYMKQFAEAADSEIGTPSTAHDTCVKLLKTALVDTFLELDRQLYLLVLAQQEKREKSGVTKSFKDAGTTACVVAVTPLFIVTANAGDSRAILSRKSALCVELSNDHKPSGPHEEKRIVKAGGYVFGGRLDDDLTVSRGFGDYRFKEEEATIHGHSTKTGLHQSEQKVSPLPEVKLHKRQKSRDEFIMVACDGIFDVRKNDHAKADIQKILLEGETNLELVCEELLDLCLLAGSRDNMTAIIVDLGNLVCGRGTGVVGRRLTRNASDGAFFSCASASPTITRPEQQSTTVGGKNT